MKQLFQTATLITFSALLATSLTAQVSTTCGNNNQKVLICHIPPGNPANAHTICVSPNAVNAHLNGNNTHNDFLGDCFSGCLGMSVYSKTQGLRNNGTAVPNDRSLISAVTGIPDKSNAPGGFYSLGFGGTMIIQMDGAILNRPGNDLTIYETSFNQPDCDDYKERAKIEVSPDLVSWQDVGTICQDGSVNIGTFDWIRFVKITDVSNPADFGNAIVDGYDLDGIECIPYTGAARIGQFEEHSEEHDELSPILTVFPNPVNEVVNLNFEGTLLGQEINIDLVDYTGRFVRSQKFIASGKSNQLQLPTSDLSSGIYMLQIKGEGFNQTYKLVKN